MFVQYLIWTFFFIVYGLCFWGYQRWLALKRISISISKEKFGTGAAIFGCAGIVFLAILPPITNVILKWLFDWNVFKDVGFFVFSFVWIVSTLPGIIKSRRLLKVAGIDPDAGS